MTLTGSPGLTGSPPGACFSSRRTRVGGTPVGHAIFFHNYSTFLARPGIYIEDIFVLPEHRGRGAGKAAEASKQPAKAKGYFKQLADMGKEAGTERAELQYARKMANGTN